MSTVRKGSEIESEITDRFDYGCDVGQVLKWIRTEVLPKKVVVPEETWLKLKELLWKTPDLLNYEKGVQWLEELRELVKE